MILTANYHGRCGECDQAIVPGQAIRQEDAGECF